VPARPGNADELGDPVVRSVDDIAERTPEADRRVEARVVPAREVEHVGELALDDMLLEALGRDALSVQLELSRREVGDADLGAEPCELDREPPGAGADPSTRSPALTK
jgi:hypothetical protein